MTPPDAAAGIVSFAGYSKDSRSTHLFVTYGNQPGLGSRAWEVPIGKVVKGMEVIRNICSNGDRIDQGKKQPGWAGHAKYLESFPKLDYIRSCQILAVDGDTEL